jgi:hypothetical protein
MAISVALKLFCSIFLFLNLTNAYLIDAKNYDSVQRDNIIEAIEEAKFMAKYAAWRIVNDKSRVDPFLKQVLGEDSGAADIFLSRCYDH